MDFFEGLSYYSLFDCLTHFSYSDLITLSLTCKKFQNLINPSDNSNFNIWKHKALLEFNISFSDFDLKDKCTQSDDQRYLELLTKYGKADIGSEIYFGKYYSKYLILSKSIGKTCNMQIIRYYMENNIYIDNDEDIIDTNNVIKGALSQGFFESIPYFLNNDEFTDDVIEENVKSVLEELVNCHPKYVSSTSSIRYIWINRILTMISTQKIEISFDKILKKITKNGSFELFQLFLPLYLDSTDKYESLYFICQLLEQIFSCKHFQINKMILESLLKSHPISDKHLNGSEKILLHILENYSIVSYRYAILGLTKSIIEGNSKSVDLLKILYEYLRTSGSGNALNFDLRREFRQIICKGNLQNLKNTLSFNFISCNIDYDKLAQNSIYYGHVEVIIFCILKGAKSIDDILTLSVHGLQDDIHPLNKSDKNRQLNIVKNVLQLLKEMIFSFLKYDIKLLNNKLLPSDFDTETKLRNIVDHLKWNHNLSTKNIKVNSETFEHQIQLWYLYLIELTLNEVAHVPFHPPSKEIIRFLIYEGARNYNDAMYYATRNGDKKFKNELLSLRPEIDDFEQGLKGAYEHGDLEEMKDMIDRGIGTIYNVFYDACRYKNTNNGRSVMDKDHITESILMMIDKGALKNFDDHYYIRPSLDYILKDGNIKIIRKIAQISKSIINSYHFDPENYRAPRSNVLFQMSVPNYHKVSEFLLDGDFLDLEVAFYDIANMNISLKYDQMLIDLLDKIVEKAQEKRITLNFNRACARAAKHCKVDIVKKIREYNVTDLNPALIEAIGEYHERLFETVEYLVEAGANDFDKAFNKALTFNQEKLCNYFLDCDSGNLANSINLKNALLRVAGNPYFVCKLGGYGYPEVLRKILEKGCPIDPKISIVQNQRSFTPDDLIEACTESLKENSGNHHKILSHFIKKDRFGSSPYLDFFSETCQKYQDWYAKNRSQIGPHGVFGNSSEPTGIIGPHGPHGGYNCGIRVKPWQLRWIKEEWFLFFKENSLK